MRLNRKSRDYFNKHHPQLAGFVSFRNVYESDKYFGSQETYKPNKCKSFTWPTKMAINSHRGIRAFDKPKIKTITIKQKKQ